MSVQAWLWVWSNRRLLLAVVLAAAAIPFGVVTVLSAAFTTTPLLQDDMIPLYAQIAEGLPVDGVRWEHLLAVDAIRFKQDFSRVTEATIRETAELFVACHHDSPEEEIADSVSPRTGQEGVTCNKRSLDEVVTDLGLDEIEQEMIRNMLTGFSAPPMQIHPAGPYVWPVPGFLTITSPFGSRVRPLPPFTPQFHAGVDIAAEEGARVLAVAAGTILYAGSSGPYGNVVRIEHAGFQTVYAHLSRIDVRVGERIAGGQVIGTVGSTGASTGPHLHFERWVDGRPVEPLAYWR